MSLGGGAKSGERQFADIPPYPATDFRLATATQLPPCCVLATLDPRALAALPPKRGSAQRGTGFEERAATPRPSPLRAIPQGRPPARSTRRPALRPNRPAPAQRGRPCCR